MKKADILLICMAAAMLLILIGNHWIALLKTLCALLLIAIVLYWKIAPFKKHLFAKYQKPFRIVEEIVTRLLRILNFIPKLQLGQQLQLDMSFMICIVSLVIILIVF